MRHRLPGLLMISLLALTFVSPAPAQEIDNWVARWDFDVYLNEKKVGKHFFNVIDVGGAKQVISNANFRVKFLMITAYRYEHRAAERWSGNCLVEFDASTNTNGERIQVSGQQTSAGFLVEAGDSPIALPECVMTFAYWNSEFLNQSRLLNPQTGEYVNVRVIKLGDEMLEVRGQTVTAKRFKLIADEVDLTLWYSSENEWLALESVAEGGHIIRYELS
jgi:hypothetical protein